jgi:hypothetical protein
LTSSEGAAPSTALEKVERKIRELRSKINIAPPNGGRKELLNLLVLLTATAAVLLLVAVFCSSAVLAVSV